VFFLESPACSLISRANRLSHFVERTKASPLSLRRRPATTPVESTTKLNALQGHERV
jgi:hypothetical protein